jgi:hypothetical protein
LANEKKVGQGSQPPSLRNDYQGLRSCFCAIRNSLKSL